MSAASARENAGFYMLELALMVLPVRVGHSQQADEQLLRSDAHPVGKCSRGLCAFSKSGGGCGRCAACCRAHFPGAARREAEKGGDGLGCWPGRSHATSCGFVAEEDVVGAWLFHFHYL